jgi:two-component sensor histidine kinase
MLLDRGLEIVPREQIEFHPEFDALREAHHRITNNLSMIAGYVRLQAASLDRDSGPVGSKTAWLILGDIAARIEAVGRLHRLLANSAGDNVIDLGGYLEETCTTLVTTLAPEGSVVLATDFRNGCMLRPDRVLPLALIISEVVTNAIKYAHPSGVVGRIEVSCRPQPAGGAQVQIRDDGVGLPEDFDPKVDGGLGFRIIRALADQLQAQWDYSSDGLGLSFNLSLPGLQS